MEHRGFNRPRQTKCIGSKFQRHWLCRAGISREIELCGVRAEQDRDGVINQLHRRVRDEHDAIRDLADIDGNRSTSLISFRILSFRILVGCGCQCSGGCRSESDAENEVETAGAREAWGGGLRQAPLRSMPNKHPP